MVALTGVSVYTSLMPDLSDVRKAGLDSGTARDVRNGIVVASSALVGAGLLMAVCAQDARPLGLAFGMAVLMGLCFEVTLRMESGDGDASAV